MLSGKIEKIGSTTAKGLLQTASIHASLSSIKPGSTTLITGPRGCGKSSLLSLASPALSLDPRFWINATLPYALDPKDSFVVQSDLISSIVAKLSPDESEGSADRLIELLSTKEVVVTIGISILLTVIDNINAFYAKTEYFRDAKALPAHEVRIIDALMTVLRNKSRKSTFILATSTLPNFPRYNVSEKALSIAQLLKRDGVSVKESKVFGYEGYSGNRGRLTRGEVETICRMRGVKESRAANKDLFYTLSGGNPGELERLIRKDLLVGLSYQTEFRARLKAEAREESVAEQLRQL
jgi:energy-coupling factor transporter ATP-binding protein EcfA2